MSYPGGWRPHLESALCLNLQTLFKRSAIWPGCDTSGGWQWTDNYTGEQTGSIGYRAKLGNDEGELTLNYVVGTGDERSVIECHIWLVTRPCYYGGRRWYFVCPYTGRHARKLYKWPGIEKFCHREAIRPKPTYASQRVGGLDRVYAQRWALRRKLGDHDSDLFGEPYKPKWMRWRTFQRYLDRDAELEARESRYVCGLLGRFGVPGLDALT
ncbi:MAG: hypothetical protein OJF55_002868 [Rhodanobacteraceae bacterium]|jgi:hypothetical protein|nr:MAG: hypothetical protein OJF55_002868 [Rhodanobacteraceae bacterium]